MPAASAPAEGQSVEAHLRLGLEYWRAGNFALASQEFETVFKLDDLPPDLRSQADIYAAKAKAFLAGDQILPSGYVIATIGKYHENDSLAGAGEARDFFGAARIGGRITTISTDTVGVNASLDYRFRNYDNADRRNESDLRWNLNLVKPLGTSNLAFGARGWISYRGDGIRRNDAAAFTSLRVREDKDSQFQFGAEVRYRSYPEGRLRYRTRTIAEASAAWTQALADGRASFTLTGRGGREFARQGRPDGDSNFFGLSSDISAQVGENIGIFAAASWQNSRFAIEQFASDTSDDITSVGTRNDDIYEVSGGVTWEFSDGWEITPAVLYLRDRSNIVGVNYSSTQVTLSLRRDF